MMIDVSGTAAAQVQQLINDGVTGSEQRRVMRSACSLKFGSTALVEFSRMLADRHHDDWMNFGIRLRTLGSR